MLFIDLVSETHGYSLNDWKFINATDILRLMQEDLVKLGSTNIKIKVYNVDKV